MDLNFFVFLIFCCFAECEFMKLTCEEIKGFVDGHNSKRLLIAQGKVPGQPAATRMNALVWDEELSQKADEWASHGVLSHNPDKTIPSKRFLTGENIQRLWTTNMNYVYDVTRATNSWFNEYVNYTYGPISRSDFSKPYHIGHYTQVVWADTVYVGCGVSEVMNIGTKIYHIVCNYGPPGNYIGETPYESGKPSNYLFDADEENYDSIYGPSCS